MSKTRNRMGAILVRGGRIALFSAALAGMLPMASFAEYQYILTPGYDPAAASIVDSSSRTSAASGLAIGRASASTVSAPLELRFRTWLKSLGTSLRSDKIKSIMLIFR